MGCCLQRSRRSGVHITWEALLQLRRASGMSGALSGGCCECFWASACKCVSWHASEDSGCHQNWGRPSADAHGNARRGCFVDDGQVFMRPTAAPPEEVLLQEVTLKVLLAFSVSRIRFSSQMTCAHHMSEARVCHALH